ncbi:MAG: hypothetical protein RBR65_01080, partial [Aliarcobacter sp.]|nr:hypothetical protein [Aliarcobacter sp.]
MILKLSFFFFFLYVNSFAVSVLISKESINFEEKIDSSKLRLQNISELTKSCIPLKLNEIQNEEYISTHYINKNSIICHKDVKKYRDSGIVFNFGGVKIEKKGKIIYENSEFIRIKNLDGTI